MISPMYSVTFYIEFKIFTSDIRPFWIERIRHVVLECKEGFFNAVHPIVVVGDIVALIIHETVISKSNFAVVVRFGSCKEKNVSEANIT